MTGVQTCALPIWPLTIVFGQSGLGKTSLLQAGAMPKLRDDGFLPIPIRLIHDPEIQPLGLVQQVLNEIAKVIGAARVEHVSNVIHRNEDSSTMESCSTSKPIESAPSLWQLFHDPLFGFVGASAALPLRPVLVFDQFEEIFTLGAEKQIGRAHV